MHLEVELVEAADQTDPRLRCPQGEACPFLLPCAAGRLRLHEGRGGGIDFTEMATLTSQAEHQGHRDSSILEGSA